MISATRLVALAPVALAPVQAFRSTPVMGWNSYNQLSCSPNETNIASAINALSDRGFVDAGYEFFQIDCGWASRDGERNASTGALKIDPDAFPNGLQGLSDLARSKDMVWSMYSDAGVRMCDPVEPSPVLGSLGHETADAELFKSLGTGYVKYDNCYIDGAEASDNAPKDPRTDFVERFTTMWDALQAVGIKGMLICQWGVPYATDDGLEGPNAWTKGLSTSFRLSDDIATGWSHVYRIYNQAVHIARSGRIGPDHFADADMLEVGNEGMTQAEQATHFAAWAMLKSALMISTDVAALSSESVALLQNKGLIEINQDAAAKPVELVQRYTGDHDVWSGPLDNGDLAVLVVDLSNTTRTLDLDLSELGLASATVRDLWDGSVTEGASSISKEVDAHGSLALRLSGLKVSDSEPEYEYTPFSEGTLTNGASLASCSGCNASKVVNVGGDEQGTVELKGIRTSQGTQDVLIDYINCEVGYLGATNERLASVKVNDGEEQVVSFPLSGYNWDRDVYRGYRVRLSGFDVDGVNTVTVSGEGWGPDLVRIGVVA